MFWTSYVGWLRTCDKKCGAGQHWLTFHHNWLNLKEFGSFRSPTTFFDRNVGFEAIQHWFGCFWCDNFRFIALALSKKQGQLSGQRMTWNRRQKGNLKFHRSKNSMSISSKLKSVSIRLQKEQLLWQNLTRPTLAEFNGKAEATMQQHLLEQRVALEGWIPTLRF